MRHEQWRMRCVGEMHVGAGRRDVRMQYAAATLARFRRHATAPETRLSAVNARRARRLAMTGVGDARPPRAASAPHSARCPLPATPATWVVANLRNSRGGNARIPVSPSPTARNAVQRAYAAGAFARQNRRCRRRATNVGRQEAPLQATWSLESDVLRKKSGWFSSRPSEPGGERAERTTVTTVREHGRRRDRAGIGEKHQTSRRAGRRWRAGRVSARNACGSSAREGARRTNEFLG
jgi:hypothetical protein